VPALNTQVANLQGAATGDVCTATLAPLTGLGSDGSLPLETSLVLNFEVGQNLSTDDTDDQMACAFLARHVGAPRSGNRGSALRKSWIERIGSCGAAPNLDLGARLLLGMVASGRLPQPVPLLGIGLCGFQFGARVNYPDRHTERARRRVSEGNSPKVSL